ncbi:MAG: hypothetical protein UT66_C0006G0011 [candidate division CPR2 bacterium GW2011_GWC1_39_9]|uniref:Uncharacterized protein n=1 Tax=candidate division CPR2 bacterium GW2011_GWC2_39_10 TaxID=1618345 RepID=A0A0G0LYE7_UNCC2|nr:MAG: hypothetical protein UT18_C0029G0002 [candidate division CPR2 bacterium GW2011_GWC2_39_10]KKR35944.1 MAG: hypothetical protein UT66_C0006G0011 [candidate division CPR2 bacterium GW2011_GWC1_39_9]
MTEKGISIRGSSAKQIRGLVKLDDDLEICKKRWVAEITDEIERIMGIYRQMSYPVIKKLTVMRTNNQLGEDRDKCLSTIIDSEEFFRFNLEVEKRLNKFRELRGQYYNLAKASGPSSEEFVEVVEFILTNTMPILTEVADKLDQARTTLKELQVLG